VGQDRTDPARPTLLVIHGRHGAASPMRIMSAARDLCNVVFLGDLDRPDVAAELRQVQSFARVIDIAGLDEATVCRLASAQAPDGVLTFSEHRLRLTAAVAAACSVPFHSRETVEVLTDKLLQRRVLMEQGVQSTINTLLQGPDDVDSALRLVGTPAVLKPRVGAGSVDTCLVSSAAECRARLAEFTTGEAPAPRDFVLEELLVGDPAQAGPFWGDYVSVESVVENGKPRTIAVTGKLPLTPPFRESGQISPAALPDKLADDVVQLAEGALRALRVRHGVTHTELKLTAQGPRIIEVNGRLGGLVADVLQRAAGYDLVTAALRLALGIPLGAAVPRWERVAFQYFLTPPSDNVVPGPRSIIEHLDEIPGVHLVDLQLGEGWRADWRAGTTGWIGVVYGTADDHTALQDVVTRLRDHMDLFWRRQTSPVPDRRPGQYTGR
jgi:biotin carboxylase